MERRSFLISPGCIGRRGGVGGQAADVCRTRSRSASCPAWSIRSTSSWISASNRRPPTSASMSVTQSRRPGASTLQTPMLDAMIARGDLDYIITAPTDKDQMVGPLQAAVDAGIKVITVDTFLGDGDYENGPATLPAQLHRLGQRPRRPHRRPRPRQGDRRQGQGLHQSTNPGVSSIDAARSGLQGSDGEDIPNVEVIGIDFNLDDAEQGDPADAAVLAAQPGSRRHLRRQRVQRPGRRHRGGECRPRRPASRSSPSTPPRSPSRCSTTAPSPSSSRRSRSTWATWRSRSPPADAAGVTSLPTRVETGFAIIDKANVDDPEVVALHLPGPE